MSLRVLLFSATGDLPGNLLSVVSLYNCTGCHNLRYRQPSLSLQGGWYKEGKVQREHMMALGYNQLGMGV